MVSLNTIYTQQKYVCNSSDTKPTAGVPNGSKLLELDTQKVYVYDEENVTWVEVTVPW